MIFLDSFIPLCYMYGYEIGSMSRFSYFKQQKKGKYRMSYEVNILVNGSRCKQYNHNGKIFIEAKQGSEYTIEVKNDTWQRILAVCSVDGLDILNGKPATENGNGYVINGNGSLKADGFRVSNDKVAKFMFDYKGGSYAASKEDGSERNVGVIGVRIFTEKVKPPPPAPTIIREEHHHHHHDHYNNWPWHYPSYPTIWCGGLTGSPYKGTPMFGSTLGSTTADCDDFNDGPTLSSTTFGSTKGVQSSLGGKLMNSPMRSFKSENVLRSCAVNHLSDTSAEPIGFDMGTKFGEAKESRVVEVDFEKGILALTTNIYYASRQSLLEMGVPLGNEKQVSFPEPFQGTKYSTPPKGWNG